MCHEPPRVTSAQSWSRLLRGPGLAVAVEGGAPSDYLRVLRDRLPPGLELVYVLPLPATK